MLLRMMTIAVACSRTFTSHILASVILFTLILKSKLSPSSSATRVCRFYIEGETDLCLISHKFYLCYNNKQNYVSLKE
jgi:hypothetical protein